MIANAASIPTTIWVVDRLLVTLKPLKQLCQNIMYNVFICKHMVNMKSMLLNIDQSSILNLKDVAVNAKYH